MPRSTLRLNNKAIVGNFKNVHGILKMESTMYNLLFSHRKIQTKVHKIEPPTCYCIPDMLAKVIKNHSDNHKSKEGKL